VTLKHTIWTPSEALADNRNLGKLQVSQKLKSGEAAIRTKNDAKRARRTANNQQDQPDPRPTSAFICQGWSKETENLGLTSTATQDHVPRQTFMALFHGRNQVTDANIQLQRNPALLSPL